MTIRLAMIGAGQILDEHVRGIKEAGCIDLVGIADVDPSKSVKADRIGVPFFLDYKKMLKETRPDAATIILPHFLHKPAAIESARRGVHILLEKPMAISSAECSAIIEEAIYNGVHLVVGMIQPYFSENIAVRKLLERGEIGSVTRIQEKRYLPYFSSDRPSWFFSREKSGGGIVMNLGAHTIDKISWITGQSFLNVEAFLHEDHSMGDVEGSGRIILETSEGIPVVIKLDGYTHRKLYDTEIFGTEGTIRLETGKGVWISRNHIHFEHLPIQPENPFKRMYHNFVDIVEKGARNDSFIRGKQVIEWIEKIYESHSLGKRIDIQ